MKLTLAQNADQVLQNVSRFTFKTFKISGKKLAAITHDPRRMSWDKPTIVGAKILELAKLQMYGFTTTKGSLIVACCIRTQTVCY